MIVRYNSLNRLDAPKLTLCNPGSVYNNGAPTGTVGILSDHEAEEIVFNFNATSELNFRVNKVRHEDPADTENAFRLYRAVQNRRLVFVDDIGYFMISGVTDGFNNGVQYKDVSAQSLDAEIQQKMIPFIENGTYKFLSDDSNTGLLNLLVDTMPLWTIGDVDEAVAARYRTFEDVDTSLNCLSFMMSNMQDAYECIFVFDIINRVINVFDQSNYVVQTDIHITKQDIINSLDVSENADDLYTAISVMGDENITISAINPLGNNVLYNFDYYIDWMSPALGTKVAAWQDDIDSIKDDYYDANVEYYDKLNEKNTLVLEKEKYDIWLTMYSRCRDNIVAEADTSLVIEYNKVIRENSSSEEEAEEAVIVVYDDIEQTLQGIDDKMAYYEAQRADVMLELAAVEGELGDIEETITAMRESVAMDTYFTAEEYAELINYIYEGSYKDEYITITDSMTYPERLAQMKTLYDRAVANLERVSKPTQEFSVGAENFIFAKEFEHWSEQLETGCLINVEVDDDDVAMLFLSNMTVNYDDHTLSMTFGNRFNKYDPRTLFDDVLGSVSKSANTISYMKEVLYPIKNGELDTVKEELEASRNLTMGSAFASDGQSVVIDGSGYTGRKLNDDGTYSSEQVKITGSNIVFTDDGWNTSKVAVGKILFGDGNTIYGINAEAVIGNMIEGENIRIFSKDGQDLFSAVDSKITTRIADYSNSPVPGDTGGAGGQPRTVSEVLQDAHNLSVRITTLENTEIDSITTSTGYTFGADGLRISKSGEEIENKIDNLGMKVSRSGTDILTADNNGVSALNLSSRQYLIIGDNSRFENFSTSADAHRTACFFVSQ